MSAKRRRRWVARKGRSRRRWRRPWRTCGAAGHCTTCERNRRDHGEPKRHRDHDEADDGLLAGLERLAGELDRQRLPGRAWAGPQRMGRRLRWTWWAGPVGAIAAAILLSVMLLYRSSDPGPGARPAPLVSLPSVPVPGSPPVQAMRPGPAMLDAAVLAHMRLGVPDVTLPAPVPVVSRTGGPDSYTWEIPEIQLPEL